MCLVEQIEKYMNTQVEIVIGKPSSNDNPTDCFVVSAFFSHGDGDGESDKTKTYPNTPDGMARLKLDVLALEAVEDFDDLEPVEELFTKLGVPGVDDAVDSFRDDFHEGDHTADYSFAAGYGGYGVSFYDENGVEHEVETEFR